MDCKITQLLNVPFISFLFIIFGLIFSNQKNLYALEDVSFIEGIQDVQKEDLADLLRYIRQGELFLVELDGVRRILLYSYRGHYGSRSYTKVNDVYVHDVPSEEVCNEHLKGSYIYYSSPISSYNKLYYRTYACRQDYERICKNLCIPFKDYIRCYTGDEVKDGDNRSCYIDLDTISSFSKNIESELLAIEEEIKKRFSTLESEDKNLQKKSKMQDEEKSSLQLQLKSAEQEIVLTKEALANVTKKMDEAYCTSLIEEINELGEIHNNVANLKVGLKKLQDEFAHYNRILVLMKDYFHFQKDIIDHLIEELRKFTIAEEDITILGSKALLFKTEMEKFIKALEALSILKSKKIPKYEDIESVEKDLRGFKEAISILFQGRKITKEEYDRLLLIAEIIAEKEPKKSPQLAQLRGAISALTAVFKDVEELYTIKVNELEESACPDKKVKRISKSQ